MILNYPKGEQSAGLVLCYTQDGTTLVCVNRDVVPVGVVNLSERGQLVIPSQIRTKYGLSKGDRFLAKDVAGKLLLEPLPRHPLLELKGALKHGTSVGESFCFRPKGDETKAGDDDIV